MRNRIFVAVCFGLLFGFSRQSNADTFGSGDNSFEIEFVTIGGPGNRADTAGNPNPAGSVDYVYQIGKFEISRDLVEKANLGGDLGITLWDMTEFGGNRPNRPATGLSWNEAARFTNWLNTSQSFPAAYNFSSQPGEVGYDVNEDILLWEEGEPGFNATNPFRNTQARYFLPSVDEWYKAAFYDPTANGGAGGYWEFATGSAAEPTTAASGTAPGTAIYAQPIEQGPADVSQAGGPSPYGVIGFGGNVWEWDESAVELVNNDTSSSRGLRGGGWAGDSDDLSATLRFGEVPTLVRNDVGFRVARIPEPSSQLLAVLGIFGLLLGRHRAH